MHTKKSRGIRLVALCAVAFTATFGLAGSVSAQHKGPSPVVNVSVFVPNASHPGDGLNNPRGLTFGPDGLLYVAEGGVGGGISTAGPPPLCPQVPAVGPYSGSFHGARISKIDSHGNRADFAIGFPSSQTSDDSGDLTSGVADVAFVDGTLYALIAAAGCSHGLNGTFNGVAKVSSNGSWGMIANLSAFQQANPVKNPNPGDFEPDGTWWSMVGVRGDLYAVEPNHGEMVKITTAGEITRVVDISASQGHVVPTSIAYHGVFYVSNLGTFDPDQLNSQSIFQITPSGQLHKIAGGLSKVLGMTFDAHNRLYVLETSYSPTDPGPEPFTGRLIRIQPNGAQEVLIDSTSGLLFFPTGMTFGPDGALYVSNVGFGPPPVGLGQILRIEVSDAN
jgi:hypothetical protein